MRYEFHRTSVNPTRIRHCPNPPTILHPPVARALNEDNDVGVVLDGIAGMFSGHAEDIETAYLRSRKQICAIALKQGSVQLVPVYW